MNFPLTTEYIGKDGNKYLFEYYEADSFEDLLEYEITQCCAVAFHGDKFIVVNNINHPGSYTLVGGTNEEGERPEETLIREIKEESNMKVLSFKPIGYQRVTDLSGKLKPHYQLRYFAIVEPYGPFVADPAGDVTEIVYVDKYNY